MNWTEWNERIGSKLVDRAFLIARRDGIEPGTALAIESLIRQARAELSREAGIDPYESVTLDTEPSRDRIDFAKIRNRGTR